MVKMNEKLCKELGGEWYSNSKIFGDNACVGIDLTWANLPKANISHSKLHDANLSDSDLWAINLSNSDLGYANLSHSTLDHANLSNSNLTLANLSNTDLTFANLSTADLKIKLNDKAIDYLLEDKENREKLKAKIFLENV